MASSTYPSTLLFSTLLTNILLSHLIIPLLLASQQPSLVSSTALDREEEDDDDDEFYVLDNPFLHPAAAGLRTRSRFLLSTIKKGTRCNAERPNNNICNGVPANNGTSLLYCCKKHCRNVLGDRNNCGKCGQKCSFGQLCCNGVCTNVAYNPFNCGKCNKKCALGLSCSYGFCGYA